MERAVTGGMVSTGATIPARPAYQAYQILHVAYSIAPIVAGVDKFFDKLVNWDKYLTPIVPNILHLTPHLFMQAVGIVEVIAGLIVAFKPKIGAYIVGCWLAGIVINLLMVAGYYDVALRDFGLCLGAFALARLSTDFDTTTSDRTA